jgi:hypothetical protein
MGGEKCRLDIFEVVCCLASLKFINQTRRGTNEVLCVLSFEP